MERWLGPQLLLIEVADSTDPCPPISHSHFAPGERRHAPPRHFDRPFFFRLAFDGRLRGLRRWPGTIDPGYRGEIKVILLTLGREPYVVHAGDRIAQMVVARYEAVEWQEGQVGASQRGSGGFGSSGR